MRITRFLMHLKIFHLLIFYSEVSAEIALRPSKVFGTTPEMCLDIQQKYDLRNADQKVMLAKIKNIAPKTKVSSWAAVGKDYHPTGRKPATTRPVHIIKH